MKYKMEDRIQYHADRFMELALAMEGATPVQITRLLAIRILINNQYSCQKYYSFLVNKSFEYYCQGKSLSKVKLISDGDKHRLYTDTIQALKILYASRHGIITSGRALLDLLDRIGAISPGIKRVSIHATRSRLEDPDLVLLEYIIYYSLTHGYDGHTAYDITRFYCCDYRHLRFKPDQATISRIRDIACYFHDPENDHSHKR